MVLYLCRHASAADANGGDDAERALTAEGIQKFRKAAAGFVALEPDVSHIYSSPLLRARQTAELLADAFAQKKHAVDVDVLECLGTDGGGALETLLRAIRSIRKSRDILAVGHEPQLSKWLSQICFDTSGSGCELKKGAIAAIELSERGPRGTLLWLLQPKHLRSMK